MSHNPASVRNLAVYLKKNYKHHDFSAIFATMTDKDSSSIINEISGLISNWNICDIKDKRFDATSLLKLTEKITNKKVTFKDSVYSAIKKGYLDGTPQIVFGSFITVSEAYSALEKIKLERK